MSEEICRPLGATPCCPTHSNSGPTSCYSQVFHSGTECCDQCPAWYPPCFWCGIYHRGPSYERCMECDHAYPTKRSLRRAMRRPFLRRIWSFSRPWFKGNSFDNAWMREVWTALTIRVKRCYFCPLCSHNF